MYADEGGINYWIKQPPFKRTKIGVIYIFMTQENMVLLSPTSEGRSTLMVSIHPWHFVNAIPLKPYDEFFRIRRILIPQTL